MSSKVRRVYTMGPVLGNRSNSAFPSISEAIEVTKGGEGELSSITTSGVTSYVECEPLRIDLGLEVETIRLWVVTIGILAGGVGICTKVSTPLNRASLEGDAGVFDVEGDGSGAPLLLPSKDKRAICPCDIVRDLFGALFTNLECLSRDIATFDGDAFDCTNDDREVFLANAGDICPHGFVSGEDELASPMIGIVRVVFVMWSDAKSTLMGDSSWELCINVKRLDDVSGAVLGYIGRKEWICMIG